MHSPLNCRSVNVYLGDQISTWTACSLSLRAQFGSRAEWTFAARRPNDLQARNVIATGYIVTPAELIKLIVQVLDDVLRLKSRRVVGLPCDCSWPTVLQRI
jgi:hypothetical protein